MIHIAICDDDFEAVKRIESIIQRDLYFQNYSIDRFYSGTKLLNSSIAFDIIILDMELGDTDGIAVAKKLREKDKDFILIFLTAYKEKIKNAFEVNTFRFLLKPLDYDVLASEVKTAFELFNSDSIIVIPNNEEHTTVRISKIIYFEALERKTCIRTISGEFTSPTSVSEYEDVLCNNGFYRTHKSFLVNFRYVSSIQKDKVILDNGEVVKLSRRKKNDFINKYYSYVRNKLK